MHVEINDRDAREVSCGYCFKRRDGDGVQQAEPLARRDGRLPVARDLCGNQNFMARSC